MSLCGIDDEEVLKKIKMQSQILFQCIADMDGAIGNLTCIPESEWSQFEFQTEAMKSALYKFLRNLKRYYTSLEKQIEVADGEQ